MKPIRIWDLPTRLFHWFLAAAVIGLIITGKVGGNAMNWHLRLSYVVFALLIFRLIWGLIGGHWSRFASFFPTPARIVSHFRGDTDTDQPAGHSPLGALSVFAMLAVLAAQIGTGLFADDEIAFSGPLTALVSGDAVYLATDYHAGVGQFLVIALVVLHVLAILFYRVVKKKNLIKPMVLGDKLQPVSTPASRDTAATRLVALVALCVSAAIVYGVIQLGQST
ncbi:cytochrome b/b6 domain-containing protein [Ottowia caeni]|uniref:cytochrome b/b6 domain-containing protein n=1 Tax=Ottowia caeni TaxID=2870339 RepID=UPI001E500968|nr:cytochrome b/b6 domain-containing protein [Ottowia caeni]